VEYDSSQPNGNRVIKALARCGECRVPTYEPVEKNKSYNVIMPAFLARGGDDFTVLERNYNKNKEMGKFTVTSLLEQPNVGTVYSVRVQVYVLRFSWL
jgi:hypothetical protein